MKVFLGIVTLALISLLMVAFHYVIIPFILMHVLILFGVDTGFWLSLGLVVLVRILIGLIKS